MTRERENRLFERFRRRDHARALGRLFDLTARELYRVASHLTRDRQEAEDLVQTTFLVAIESRASFHGDADVLPWLLGILANRARDLRKRASRRQARPLSSIVDESASQPEDENATDPVARAADGELAAATKVAVRALPEPYRHVLLLHLEHGLSGQEIGEAHDRQPATVRSQIHRGLEMLRRALPRGFGAAGAGVFVGAVLGRTAKAEMKRRVLSAAASHVPVAAGVTGVVLAMKKTIALIAVAAVVAVAVVLEPWADRAAGVVESPGAANVQAATVDDRVEPADDTGVVAAPRVTPKRESVAIDGAGAPSTLRVRVSWSDNEPANAVNVRMRAAGPDGQRAERRAVTDALGVAEFVAVSPGEYVVSGDRGGSAAVEVLAQSETNAELVIPEGVDVRGVVRDTDGVPVGGASIWLSPTVDSLSDGIRGLAVTAADGRFEVRDVERARLISATKEGEGAAVAQRVGGVVGGVVELEFELLGAGPGVLEGVVLDPDGNPLPWALVQYGYDHPSRRSPEPRSTPVNDTRTDADGRFRLAGLMAGPPGAHVFVMGEGAAVWLDRVPIPASRGRRFITIRLQRGATLRGTARRMDGEPVPATVRVYWDDIEPREGYTYNGPTWARSEGVAVADGSFEIRNLRPGPALIRAERKEDELAIEQMEFVAGEVRRWDPRLGSGLTISGRVVDEEGRGLPDYLVSASAAQAVTRVLPSRTNAAGEFTIERVFAVDYSLRANDSRGGMNAFGVEAVARPGKPIRLVVPAERIANARITGRVLGPDGQPVSSLSVTVSRLGRDGRVDTSSMRAKAEARFRSKLLWPGTYRVDAYSKEHGHLDLGLHDVAPSEEIDVGTGQYERPGELIVRVVDADGVAIRDGVVIYRREGRGSTRGLVLSSGEARMRAQPGRVRVSTRGFRLTAASVAVDVPAGGRGIAQLVVPHGFERRVQYPAVLHKSTELIVVLRDQSGRTVNIGGGRWDNVGEAMTMTRRFAPGRYTLTLEVPDGRSSSVDFIVDAVPDPDALIVLPSPW